jgi:hypothetical protein
MKWMGAGAAGWMTAAAQLLAREEEQSRNEPAQSLIVLWMGGGPSQLETFDPHPGKKISGETKAINTVLPGVLLAEGMEQIADQLGSIALIRSMVSKEGDHERGTYLVKSGYSPLPALVHPSIGAVCCHELPPAAAGLPATDIPRHVSIAPGQWPGRGGFLGDEFDAFKVGDPRDKVPDVTGQVDPKRYARRYADLDVVESAFARGREGRSAGTLHRETMYQARVMMTSKQLSAFDVSQEPAALQSEYGDTSFGRGCLAARRLIEVGVRCVEVSLEGWDTHVNNFSITRERVAALDPAFAALIRDLKARDLFNRTIVLCAGEFGRTPTVNPLGGRDHWPTGFSIALAGGRIRGGVVIGETDPEGGREVADPQRVPDVHATILTALGIDPHKELITPIQRPMKLTEGEVIGRLL